MELKIYIRLTFYHPPENQNIAWIDLIELSPPTFNHRVKYGLQVQEEQYTFDELMKSLKEETEEGQRYKYHIKRGDRLGLFVMNTATGQRENFTVDGPRDWPQYGKPGDSFMTRTDYYEITHLLKKIGIFELP